MLRRSVLYVLLWILLTGGEPASWVVGAPTVLLAAGLGARLLPAGVPRARWLAAAVFLPFFLIESLRGGWDVARRALDPALPIRPGRVIFSCSLPAGPARTFFANVVGLLPGTLFLEDGPGGMELHVVDSESSVFADLAELEVRVARLFGVGAES